MKIIIYGSIYGTTKKYACELSKKIDIPAISYEEFKYDDNYDTFIYMGALYAGGVFGMKKVLSKIPSSKLRKFIIVTIGLSDTTDRENVEKIKNRIKNQVSDEVFEQSNIFCLRGGIDYSRLSLKHKVMMRLVYNKAKSIPEEKRNEETRSMIDTYNKKVDFVDFENLKSIIDAVQVI